jgi:hypothetical protein
MHPQKSMSLTCFMNELDPYHPSIHPSIHPAFKIPTVAYTCVGRWVFLHLWEPMPAVVKTQLFSVTVTALVNWDIGTKIRYLIAHTFTYNNTNELCTVFFVFFIQAYCSRNPQPSLRLTSLYQTLKYKFILILNINKCLYHHHQEPW